MKRILFICMLMISIGYGYGQAFQNQLHDSDPFCRMVRKIFDLELIRYRSELRVKNLFETDTLVSRATVILKKEGNRIEMLRIIPDEGEDELLYCHDSSWLVDHMAENMVLMDNSIKALSNNSLSSFFPFSVFDLDTTVCHIAPFWKTIYQDEDITIIDLDIKTATPELSDVKVRFTANNKNSLLSGVLQEYTYLNIGQGCEKLRISDYSFMDPDDAIIPEYYTIYGKDLSIFLGESAKNKMPDTSGEDIIFDSINLFDLQGRPFKLPAEGLSLFDLWYTGCAPCIKSAPVIEKIYQYYKDEMYFFSVNEIDDDTLKIKNFSKSTGLTVPVLLAGHRQISSRIPGSSGYPLFFILDNSSGKILWLQTGYSDDLEKVITESINKYL